MDIAGRPSEHVVADAGSVPRTPTRSARRAAGGRRSQRSAPTRRRATAASSTMHSERLLLGNLGEQASARRRPTRKRSGAGPASDPNTVAERSALWDGQPVQPIQHGAHKADGARCTPGPSPTRRLQQLRHASGRHCSTTRLSNALFPAPASPRRTTTRLRPLPASAKTPSSASHSARRPRILIANPRGSSGAYNQLSPSVALLPRPDQGADQGLSRGRAAGSATRFIPEPQPACTTVAVSNRQLLGAAPPGYHGCARGREVEAEP